MLHDLVAAVVTPVATLPSWKSKELQASLASKYTGKENYQSKINQLLRKSTYKASSFRFLLHIVTGIPLTL